MSESSRARMFAILEPYGTGKKNFDGEWQTINDALTDPDPYVRDQASAVLGATASLAFTQAYLSPQRLIRLPDSTKEIVIQQFSESQVNLRENAVRVITVMEGGVPRSLVPRLLQMAKTDPEGKVRGVVIAALASLPMPPTEITEFWIQTLSDKANRQTRESVLSAFRGNAPSDPRVIALVIEALKDPDYFVRQEAIASVRKIGKPAAAALPLLMEIRDAKVANERDDAMRMNAESAIRILSDPPANR